MEDSAVKDECHDEKNEVEGVEVKSKDEEEEVDSEEDEEEKVDSEEDESDYEEDGTEGSGKTTPMKDEDASVVKYSVSTTPYLQRCVLFITLIAIHVMYLFELG